MLKRKSTQLKFNQNQHVINKPTSKLMLRMNRPHIRHTVWKHYKRTSLKCWRIVLTEHIKHHRVREDITQRSSNYRNPIVDLSIKFVFEITTNNTVSARLFFLFNVSPIVMLKHKRTCLLSCQITLQIKCTDNCMNIMDNI